MKYKCGDIENWTATDEDCKIANETVADFDGWLEDLEDWQVEDIRNAILTALRSVQKPRRSVL